MSNQQATSRFPLSAGTLAFSPDGVLFVADNKQAAIFAYPTERGAAPAAVEPFLIEDIDLRAAFALNVKAGRLISQGR